jgi:quercetin dioxygenase-like cupin family protein
MSLAMGFCQHGTSMGFSRSKIDFGSTERFFSLRRELGVEAFGLNQMTLQPGQRGRIHRHQHQEEVYLVLAGKLTLVVEGEVHELETGALARVPAGTRRQLENRALEPCVLVAIGAAGEHVARDGEAFDSWEQRTGRPPQEVPLPDDLPLPSHEGFA